MQRQSGCAWGFEKYNIQHVYCITKYFNSNYIVINLFKYRKWFVFIDVRTSWDKLLAPVPGASAWKRVIFGGQVSV